MYKTLVWFRITQFGENFPSNLKQVLSENLYASSLTYLQIKDIVPCDVMMLSRSFILSNCDMEPFSVVKIKFKMQFCNLDDLGLGTLTYSNTSYAFFNLPIGSF